MTAPVSIFINDTKIILSLNTLTIEKLIEERSVASFDVIDLTAAATYNRGDKVVVYEGDTAVPAGKKLFAGFIDTPGRGRLASNTGLLHEVSCMDNHYLADKRLVVKSYTDKTLSYIVNDIVTDYLAAEGITVGEIQTGPTLSSAIFNYVKISEAFDSLKELSGMIWFIDEEKALYFIDRSTYAAPWDLDGSTYKALNGSVKLLTGNYSYRNRQYVRGGTGLTDIQTENFTGDGIVKSFACGYPLALEPTITEDAAAKTVGIKGVETGKDYYWSKGDNIVYAAAAPGAAVDVEVQYYGQYPLITMVSDYGQQLVRQAAEGGTGIVEDIVTEAQHESSSSIKESAKGKLLRYCKDAEKLSYATRDSGLSPGQLQKITESSLGFTAHEMLIESVGITTADDIIIYSVTAITGPVLGSWSRFFSNLLTRQDKTIKIGDELLLVLLQQPETLELTEATDIHSDDFSGGLVNRWIALPPTQGAGHNIEHERLELSGSTAIDSDITQGYRWG
ncbi:MAG: hypothetical protein PHN78_05345 [Dehalococcoidales bacterium]|nr:hypothetical protein [Dehalococcoidales bacterium]